MNEHRSITGLTGKGADACRRLSEDDTSVFIAYSWDSAEHKAWTLRLATDLMSRNHAVVIDQLAPPSFFGEVDGAARAARLGMSCRNAVIVMSDDSGWKSGISNGPRGFLSEGALYDELALIRYNVLISQMNPTALGQFNKPFLRVVTVLRRCKHCVSDYPIVDFRNDREYETSLLTLLFALECDWRVKGRFTEPMFFALKSDGDTTFGKLVTREDPDAPKDLEEVAFLGP
jgi:hypothetical protein